MKETLLHDYHDVFVSTDKLKSMSGEPMEFNLKDNNKPYAIHTARNIPFAWRD